MDLYQVLMVSYAIVVILGVIKGYGESRKLVIFKNYDDLGLTFLIPASFVLLFFVLSMIGINQTFIFIIAGSVSIYLMYVMSLNTYTYI